MKVLLKILSVFFALGFIGQLIAGNLFIAGLVVAVICGYFGWKPSKQENEK